MTVSKYLHLPAPVSRHLPAIALAVVAFAAITANATSASNLDLIILIGIYGLIATSLGMCYGLGGMMSLCQASFAALGAYGTAVAGERWGIPPIAGLAIAIAVPAAVAYPLARLIVRMSPLALALATLFVGTTIEIVLSQGGNLTGGYVGIGGIPPLPGVSDNAQLAGIVWTAVILAILLYTNLVHSAAGRALNTLRVDALRSEADGDRGPRRLSGLFAFAAGLAGVGGWLYAHYMSYLAPESLSMELSLTLLLMVLVGGSGHVLGPVLGAALLTFLNDALPDDMQGLMFGVAVVLVLLIAPRGILGTAENLWHGYRRRTSGGSGEPAAGPAASNPSHRSQEKAGTP